MKLGLMVGATPEIDPKGKQRAINFWMYGSEPAELAKAWGIDKDIAEIKRCTNCEYFDNSKRTLIALEGKASQGACTKFKFLCEGAQSCQAWDCVSEKWEDDTSY